MRRCAACVNARGYTTACPYCGAPGDLQITPETIERAASKVMANVAVDAADQARRYRAALERIRDEVEEFVMPTAFERRILSIAAEALKEPT